MQKKPPSEAESFRTWFGALRRAHTVAALAVIGVCCIAFPLIGPVSGTFQLALVATLALCLSLPHASLDQYTTFIALQPRFGGFWPIGLIVIYGGLTVTTALAWLVAPGTALLAIIALSTLHYGLGDVEDRSAWRWLEVFTRGSAPWALMVLFDPATVAAFAGWLILDVRLATVAVYDHAVPASVVWEAAWATVVLRNMWRAMRAGSWRAGLVAAEMSVLVLAFAILPPMIAFALYACLLHAPRHVFDLADRNPRGDPARALRRVLRATVLPTAMALAAIAAIAILIQDAPMPRSHIYRAVVWLVTAFSVPHMIFTLLATRTPGGRLRVAPAAADQGS